jgi:hypothetical protein
MLALSSSQFDRCCRKSLFWQTNEIFLAPLVRLTRGSVHIESHKSDRRPSYMPYGGLRRRRQRKTDLREIFGAAQFSTFSTALTLLGRAARSVARIPLTIVGEAME